MKLRTLSILSVALTAAASLSAQSSTISGTAAGISNPTSSVTIAPNIASGVKSTLTNGTEGNKTAGTVGAFVTPGFELGTKSQSFDFALTYSLELVSAQGFGGGQEVKSMTKNSYMFHNPVAIATLRLTPEWSFVNTSDLSANMSNLKGEDYLAAVNIAEVYRKINSNLSISAGYRIDYKGETSKSVLVDDKNPFAAQLNAGQKSGLPAEVLAENANVGRNPAVLRNVGLVRAKVKFNEGVSTNASGEIGAILSDKNLTTSKTYVYRLNTDTAIQATKNLSLAIRARGEFTNPEGADGFNSTYTGRLIAGYKLNDSWSADLNSTLVLVNKIDFSGTTVYENETYAGLTYSF